MTSKCGKNKKVAHEAQPPTILFQTRANQLICSSVFSHLSLFGIKRNSNTNTLWLFAMLNKNRSFTVDGHSQKVEAYLSVRERILRSELKSSLVAILPSKTTFWCRSPIIIWNSAKILKYTAFILLDYDWFDLTPRSFWLVNYTPIISFLPTFVHVPANKRCSLTENYTLQIQWKYQVLFVYHVTEPLRILESHVPESHVPEFHVPEFHVSVPLLVNHKTAVSIQIFHGLLLVGKPEFWGWSLAEKASLTCFTAAASLYKSNSSAFFNWMSLSYIDFREFCTHFHYHNLLILNTHKSDFALNFNIRSLNPTNSEMVHWVPPIFSSVNTNVNLSFSCWLLWSLWNELYYTQLKTSLLPLKFTEYQRVLYN